MSKALFVIALCAALAGCEMRMHVDSKPAEPMPAARDDAGSAFWVFADERTGCQYLAIGRGGITPRLQADGRQICTTTQGQSK